MLHSRQLKDRIVVQRSHSIPHISQYTAVAAVRGQYKQYDEQKLSTAYNDIITGKLSMRRAAIEYGIPRSTLSDRVTGKVMGPTVKSGPTRYLNDSEELELENFIIKMAKIGYAYSRKEIIQLVQEFIDKKKPHDNIVVTSGWWECYRRRHPNIVLRKSEPLSHICSMATQPEILEGYFQELECALISNDIYNKPSQIFNMDESGFPLDPHSPFVLCKRGECHPAFITSGGKTQITVLACCNAAGYSIPPFVIFQGQIMKQDLTIGEVPGTMYGMSVSGWIDSELFDGWFQGHFLAYAPASRLLLLLLNGHSLHFNPTTIRRAAEEKIIIFCLPPRTTHKTQPLDKGCFSPLKSYWKEECQIYLQNNPGKIITRFQFSQIFCKAWMKGMNQKNIIAGFKTTGIYPFNPRVLVPESNTDASDSPLSLCKATGLKYIPLYSPQPKFQKSLSHIAELSFTDEEMVRYERRYEERYDLPDERYEQWLQLYHPQLDSQPKELTSTSTASDCQESFDSTHLLSYNSLMSKMLSQKIPEIKVPEVTKTTARVLTSAEHLKLLEEKRRKKEEEMALKEERKLQRQKKKEEQMALKEERKLQSQRKQQEKLKKASSEC